MKIVAIHGIAQTYEGSSTLKSQWLPALQTGLEEAGVPLIKAGDLEVVGYGALFRPAGTRAGSIPQLDARDVQTGWEQDLLVAWWRAAAALSEASRMASEPDVLGEDPSIQGPDFQGRARTPAVVQRALRQLAKSRFFQGIGPERALIFGLKQVRLFLHDPTIKSAALDRVSRKVDASTRVIIGHSLGSIIAYEALCAHPEWNVHTLVTLGSPLGIANLVFDALTPRPKEGVAAWPHVQQWFNIADVGDIVALEKQLAPRFGPVVDRLVYNGWKSHAVERYLTARETGEAVATGLNP